VATNSLGTNPTARAFHTAIWTGTKMVIWGGTPDGVGYLNTGGVYDPNLDTWTVTSVGVNVPSARAFHTAIWTGTKMVVWGGTADGVGYLNTGGVYDPSLDSWTATSVGANVPTSVSQGHTAVWTGVRMIIWGASTGGQYDPTSDTWTAISTGTNAPAARNNHTAVWTGTKMIVWGGVSSIMENTGGVYDPGTNTWTATYNGGGSPEPRMGHTAVWTGTKMIVWGGCSDTVTPICLNSGGQYDPASDTWTATSTGTNVPAVRFFHTAVWTGTKMIVWGGLPGFSTTDYNTGGQYDPGADTWTATSVGANVPGARHNHTAVWTGTKMIVWGGYNNSSGYTNTGGQYDPTANTWTATSVGANVPVMRGSHSAVWTGSKMIVWGGDQGAGTNSLATGAQYDPSADTWSTTSVGANVPAGRSNHTAVWTGAKMVIFGGFDMYSNATYNSGGAYSP
jgi:hypothetical protein